LLTKEEMGRILKDVLIKYQIMEKKVNELSACVSMKRKKINVIEWLNANKPIEAENRLFDFDTWTVQCITVNRNHLEYVFEHGFVKAVSYIILQLNAIPICAFTHKDGSLYVYNNNNNNNNNNNSWGHITEDQLGNLISTIRIQINSEFKLWQDEHKEAILKDETYRDLYLNNISKVMYTTYKNEEDLTLKIQRDLYSNLKIGITV
jgi:hypothetical protein